jgi:hypothetical protein
VAEPRTDADRALCMASAICAIRCRNFGSSPRAVRDPFSTYPLPHCALPHPRLFELLGPPVLRGRPEPLRLPPTISPPAAPSTSRPPATPWPFRISRSCWAPTMSRTNHAGDGAWEGLYRQGRLHAHDGTTLRRWHQRPSRPRCRRRFGRPRDGDPTGLMSQKAVWGPQEVLHSVAIDLRRLPRHHRTPMYLDQKHLRFSAFVTGPRGCTIS